MKKTLLTLMLVAAAAVLPATAADAGAIKAGSSIYIEKMQNDLDGYIKAEIIKQKIPLKVVGSLDDAQFVMTGFATDEERRKWHEGWLTAEKDKTAGNVQVLDKGTKAMLWAGEAGDRSFWWGSLARGGHRKVAARIVSNFKKAIQK